MKNSDFKYYPIPSKSRPPNHKKEKMKTKGLSAIAVVAILLAAVLAPAMGLSLLNDSNSSVISNETENESIKPVPETPTPSPSQPIEEDNDNATATDTETNETETTDEIPPPTPLPLPLSLSENLKIIGKDYFSAEETPEFVIELQNDFIAAAGNGKPAQIQIYAEDGDGKRIEVIVEETSPNGNSIRYHVTIPNHKTSKFEHGIYKLVVEVGEQCVKHPFKWGLEPEILLSDNVKIIGNDSFSANETPEFVIEIEQAFIDAIANVTDGTAKHFDQTFLKFDVQVQIYVEGCEGEGSRSELFVEEEETSPSSDVIRYLVTIPSNKTGTEEITPGIYTLVVEVGSGSVEYPFEWGLLPTVAPVLTTDKKHFALNEKPSFKFNYTTESKAEAGTNETAKHFSVNAFSKRIVLKTWITPTETIKTAVYYKDKLTDIEPEIEKIGECKFYIKLPTKRAFRAGLYKLKVELVKDNVTYVEEQDFTWGVLAINTHKSIYLPGETAFIGMAVLDYEGHMVCDADVTLTITDPRNKETVLSTSNGSINVSPQCSVYGVTNLPDYYTNYTVGGVGTYVMNLTAVTSAGVYTIMDNFTVQSTVDFEVARDGPTRIYPVEPYRMKFTIKANKNYNGLIKEYVPASFAITPQEGLTVTTAGDTKILSWHKNLVKGETYNIHYEFDAPDISPYLFVLGNLEIGDWQEARQWMIASDDLTGGGSCKTVATGIIHGGIHYESYGTYPAGEKYTDENGKLYWKLTHEFQNVPSNIILAKVYTGCWGGSPCRGGDGFNISINDFTSANYNAVDPCLSQPDRCDVLNWSNNSNSPSITGVCQADTTGCGQTYIRYEATPHVGPGSNTITLIQRRATVNPQDWGGAWATWHGWGSGYGIFGTQLLVLYENESMPLMHYFINEGTTLIVKGSGCEDDSYESFIYFNGSKVYTGSARKVTLSDPAPGSTGVAQFNGHDLGACPWNDIPPGYLIPFNNLFYYYDDTQPEDIGQDQIFDRTTGTRMIVEYERSDLTVTNISAQTRYANYINTINATLLNNIGNVSSNSTGFDVTLYANGTKVDVQHVSNISAGESKEVSFTWNPTSEGTYELNVTADVEDIVLETNEANNTKIKNVIVESAPVPVWRDQSSNVSSIPNGGAIELRAQGKAKFGLDRAVLWTDETGAWKNCTDYGSPMQMGSLESHSFTHTSDADWNVQTLAGLDVSAGDVKLSGGNLALNKPSNASSYLSGYPPCNGNDGVGGTYWYAWRGPGFPEWWYVDLGGVMNVNKIVIKTFYGVDSPGYNLSISDDASNWTTKISGESDPGGGDKTHSGLDWSCRYVRIDIPVTIGYVYFGEFEVYGKSGLLTSTATSTGNPIVSVTPTWNSTEPTGTSLSVNVSVDDGVTWKPANKGEELTWDSDIENKKLKYKVLFKTDDIAKTPVLHDITLNYKTKTAPEDTWVWSNFTWQNASVTAGTTVGWKICYSDVMGETTCTNVMTFDVVASDTTPPYTTGHDPAPGATGVPRNTNITVHVKDDGKGVDNSTLVMKVDGSPVTPVISGSPADYTLVYDPADFNFWQVVHVTVDASDLASPPNDMTTDSYSFTIVGDKPDLVIKDIDAYHNATGYPPYFNLSNEVDVVIENVGGVASGASNVSLYINESYIGKTDVPGLAVLSNTTAQFKWTPSGCDCEDGCNPDTFVLEAIADCDGVITELNETNNASSTTETAYWNGYSADELLVEAQHGTIHGGLNFTTGDGSYTSLTTHGSSKDIHYNLTLPSGATVALSRLNVYYLWSKYDYPIMTVNITNQTGTHTVPLSKSYNDRPCSSPGVSSNYPSGNYVYNVTPYITGSGDYTVTVKNNGNETNESSFAIYAPGLVILYEDSTAPEYEYWILEGADMLEGGRKSGSGNLALAECINNATLPGIDSSNVERATLGLVAPAGGDPLAGYHGYLYFNGNEIGTDVYHGHSSQYSKTLNGIAMHIGSTDAKVGVNISDVKGYLDASNNIVGQGDDGNSMVVANVFLLVKSTGIGNAPTVDSITITPDDDGATAGVQINPVPNSSKAVNITAQVSDPNGYDDISTVKITDIVPDPTSGDPSPVTLNFISGSGTTATYEGTFDMQFYDISTTYTVTVTATDTGSLTGSNSSSFKYQTCIALELDVTSIAFGSAGPGGSSEVIGDTVFPNAAPTIKNNGNVKIDMNMSGTDMSGSGTIPVNNIADDLNNPDGYTALSNTPTEHDELNLTAGASSIHGIDFKLNVPLGTSAGDYSGTVTLEAKLDD